MLGRKFKPVESPGRGQRAVEVVLDLLESRDDGAPERGEAVEDEEVRIAARRQTMIEVDVDPLRLGGGPRHFLSQPVWCGWTGGHDVWLAGGASRGEDHGRPRCLGLGQQAA